ncbi:MAG: hypothetical protein J6P87_02510 [Lachnospiraceae bacterium]|nr:hypothetical protein [Lachnospiraceae bacterium]
MEKAAEWFFGKINELILFLEYPVDYIVEFGDDLKRLSTGGKIAKVAKMLVTMYICLMIIYILIFVVLLHAFLGGRSGSSVAEGMYEDALKASRDEAIRDAESGRGSWKDVADIEQEMKNHGM